MSFQAPLPCLASRSSCASLRHRQSYERGFPKAARDIDPPASIAKHSTIDPPFSSVLHYPYNLHAIRVFAVDLMRNVHFNANAGRRKRGERGSVLLRGRRFWVGKCKCHADLLKAQKDDEDVQVPLCWN